MLRIGGLSFFFPNRNSTRNKTETKTETRSETKTKPETIMQNPIIIDGFAFRLPLIPSRYRANCSKEFSVML